MWSRAVYAFYFSCIAGSMGVVGAGTFRAYRGGCCAVGSSVGELIAFVTLYGRDVSLLLQSVRWDDYRVSFNASVQEFVCVLYSRALDFESRVFSVS